MYFLVNSRRKGWLKREATTAYAALLIAASATPGGRVWVSGWPYRRGWRSRCARRGAERVLSKGEALRTSSFVSTHGGRDARSQTQKHTVCFRGLGL